VIPNRNADHLAGPDKAPGEIDIVPTRFELTARVIVVKQHPRSPIAEGLAEEVCWIDGRLGAGPETVLMASDQPVPPIDGEESEDLEALHLQSPKQIFADHCRIAENFGLAQSRSSDAVTEFEAGEDRRGLCRADSIDTEQFGCAPFRQLRESPSVQQQGIGLDDRTPTTFPVRMRTANNSASESTAGPNSSMRSRGRDDGSSSRMNWTIWNLPRGRE